MPLPNLTNIAAEIAKLPARSALELQAEWGRVIGGEPPKSAHRDYLLRSIAHHLQSKIHGALSPTLKRSLLKLAQNGEAAEVDTAPVRTLQNGARILKEWQGAVHEVEVLASGYRYQDRTYKSLSIIAREITGTRWSGPAFFGLKRQQPEAGHGL